MSKKALVVGGTRRVGRWVSEALLAAGWEVLAVYRSRAVDAQELQRELQAAGLPFSVLRADAAAAGELEAALAASLKELDGSHGAAPGTTGAAREEERTAAEAAAPGLSLLVNAAGPALHAPLSLTSAQQLEELWRGNVLAVHNAVQAALPHLQAPAAIISFISAGNDSLRAYRDVPAYSACKSMLLSYSRSLARELAPRGISVNCIALGVTDLPPEGVPALDSGALPLQSYVQQEDVARAIWYLAAGENAQLTGSVLNIGGGFGL